MEQVRGLTVFPVEGPIPTDAQRYMVHWWSEDGQEWGTWFDLLPKDADPTPIFDGVILRVLEA